MFVLFVLGWILIGLITAFVRWYWIEGREKIRVAQAEYNAECAMAGMSAVYGDLEMRAGMAKRIYDGTTTANAFAHFFTYSVLVGPVGTLMCIFRSDGYAMPRAKT